MCLPTFDSLHSSVIVVVVVFCHGSIVDSSQLPSSKCHHVSQSHSVGVCWASGTCEFSHIPLEMCHALIGGAAVGSISTVHVKDLSHCGSYELTLHLQSRETRGKAGISKTWRKELGY